MKQTGYIIENLLDKSKYFTSTSSYDRPQWVKKEQASVYETADAAERAMKKMIKYGVNSIRMINLAELAAPLRSRPPVDELPPDDSMDLPQDAPEDQMVARNQEEVDPDQYNKPDHEDDIGASDLGDAQYNAGDEIDADSGDLDDADDANDDWYDADGRQNPNGAYDAGGHFYADRAADFDAPEENEEITNKSHSMQPNHTVSYKGQEYVVVADLGNGTMQIANPQKPNKVITVHNKELLPIHESADVSGDPDEKVSVPANVKSELATVIATYQKEAKDYNERDDARASFALTFVSAASEIAELLAIGTVGSIKQAQVRFGALMSPIAALFPAATIKFIASGGRKPTLKDLFDDKRTK